MSLDGRFATRILSCCLILLLVPSVAALDVLRAPTLRELKQRVHAVQGDTRSEVNLVSTAPVSYLIRGLFSEEEQDELEDLAFLGLTTRQEVRSDFQVVCSLRKAPDLNASDIMQVINSKLATVAGLPETHIEEGHFSMYRNGYEMESLHLDNHHAVLEPQRVVSFLIYLLGEDEGVVGGGTVFPLADGVEAPGSVKRSPPLSDRQVEEWDRKLASEYTPGDEPQHGRVCPAVFGGSNLKFEGADLGQPVFDAAEHLCRGGDGHGVLFRARHGDVAMFYHHVAGNETAKALHTSCGVREGNKIILAKFIRAGPKPFYDEIAFAQAQKLHRAAAGKKQEI